MIRFVQILIFLIIVVLCAPARGGFAPSEEATPNQPVIIEVVESKESNLKWLIGVILVPIIVGFISWAGHKRKS